MKDEIEAMRKTLIESISKLENGELEPSVAAEMSNMARAVIQLCELQNNLK